MFMTFGDYRSMREARNWQAAWVVANRLDGGERDAALRDWWRVVDLDEVARLVIWRDHAGEYDDGRDALRQMGERAWSLALCGILIASSDTLDLVPLAVKFARVLSEGVAYIHRGWAFVNDPGSAGVTQEVFDALDSGDLERIRDARLAVVNAEDRTTYVNATWATKTMAAWASDATTALMSARFAVDAVLTPETASGASGSVAMAVRAVATLSMRLRSEKAHRWTVHVLQHIKETTP